MKGPKWRILGKRYFCVKLNEKNVYNEMKKLGNNRDWKAVVDFYGKCGGYFRNDYINTLYVKACVNCGQMEMVGKLLEWLEIKDINDYSEYFMTVLMDYYGKCGNIDKAYELYRQYNGIHNHVANLTILKGFIYCNNSDLGDRFIQNLNIKDINEINVKMMTSLIEYYMHFGNVEHALKIYGEWNDRHNDVTNLVMIKGFINNKEYKMGKEFIDQLNINEYSKHSISFVSTLIHFYGQNNELEMAHEVFNEYQKNNICLSALMNCYIDNDNSDKAIRVYETTILKYDDVTNLLYIKACNNMDDNQRVINFMKKFKDTNKFSVQLITNLIDFYWRQNDMENALGLYKKCNTKKNDITKTIMIKGFVESKQFTKGKEFIHQEFDSSRFNHFSMELKGAILDFYVKSNLIQNAVDVFEKLESRNEVNSNSLSIMMHGYILNNRNKNALHLYEKYKNFKDDVTDLLYIKACLIENEYNKCQQFIESLNLDSKDINNFKVEFITKLIDFYRQTHQHTKAIQLFKDYNSITNSTLNLVMIKTYMELNDFTEVISILEHNKHQSINEQSTEYINTVLDFWCKQNDIQNCWHIFNEMLSSKKTTVTISIMMNACINNNEFNDAISLYKNYNGVHDDVTHMCYVKACLGIENHSNIIHLINALDLTNIDQYSMAFINSLIDFYGKIGDVPAAENLYHCISPNKIIVDTVGTLMNVYKINKEYEKAFDLFVHAQTELKLKPHEYMYSIALYSCGELTSMDKAQQIIDQLSKNENETIYSLPHIQASIIIVYAKCKQLNEAINIFNETTKNKDSESLLILYEAMLDSYAKSGNISDCLLLWNELNQNIEICSNK